MTPEAQTRINLLYNPRVTPTYTSGLFMQNKPNLPNDKMNLTLCLTNHYKNQRLCRRRRIKPNQTQKQPSTKNLSRQFIGKLPNSHSLIEKLP